MKISTILDHIDNGHMALPEFQRGYVWNSDQVRKLIPSLYLRRHGWATDSATADHREDGALAAGVAKLLLDGQQRITSIYGIVREELSQPVAILLDEEPETISIASQAGYRCFTSTGDFRRYVLTEIVTPDTLF